MPRKRMLVKEIRSAMSQITSGITLLIAGEFFAIFSGRYSPVYFYPEDANICEFRLSLAES